MFITKTIAFYSKFIVPDNFFAQEVFDLYINPFLQQLVQATETN